MPVRTSAVAYPVLTITFTKPMLDPDYIAHHAFMKKHLQQAEAEGSKIAMVVDGATVDTPSPAARKFMAEFLDENRLLIATRCAAAGVVLSNGIQRGVLTAVLWLAPSPCPIKAFGTVDEADAWVRSVLGVAGYAKSG